ncbi:MAG: peptidase M28, partial [Planctomycetes bacterium]|nr:peptidase M28 [Planctomycetota bacterium]
MLRRPACRLLLVCSLVASTSTLCAQSPAEKVDLDVVAKIKEEALNRSQVMATLSYLTDVYGPRLTGSPNIKAASDWAVKQLGEWGVDNAHLETWGPFGRGWTLDAFTANVVEPQFIPLIAHPKAWSPSTGGVLRGEVLYFDAKTEADLEKYKGKLKDAIGRIAPPRELKAQFGPPGQRQTVESLLALANAEPAGGAGRRQRPPLSPEQRANFQIQTKKWQMCYAEGAALVL